MLSTVGTTKEQCRVNIELFNKEWWETMRKRQRNNVGITKERRHNKRTATKKEHQRINERTTKWSLQPPNRMDFFILTKEGGGSFSIQKVIWQIFLVYFECIFWGVFNWVFETIWNVYIYPPETEVGGVPVLGGGEVVTGGGGAVTGGGGGGRGVNLAHTTGGGGVGQTPKA